MKVSRSKYTGPLLAVQLIVSASAIADLTSSSAPCKPAPASGPDANVIAVSEISQQAASMAAQESAPIYVSFEQFSRSTAIPKSTTRNSILLSGTR